MRGSRVVAALTLVGLVAGLPDPGLAQVARVGHPAPEVTGGPWVNSAPLSLERLRGRVVYVEFWTYG